MPQPRILIIEDGRDLPQSLTEHFNREGYETFVANDGREVLPKAQAHVPDVVLFDLMLPGLSGLDFCRELRSNEHTRGIPIFITVRSALTDQIVGFSLGADDQVSRPFSNKVLPHRIKTLLRRAEGESGQDDAIEHLGVRVDRTRHRASIGKDDLELTPTEFRLLEIMLRRPGRAFSRAQLVAAAIADGAVVLERTIDAHIRTIRRKLSAKGAPGELIETVRGIGYRFRETYAQSSGQKSN
jgi:two-component system, OmpR family, phosphate regulon response regulator PhoB